jgi:hypothetical protein
MLWHNSALSLSLLFLITRRAQYLTDSRRRQDGRVSGCGGEPLTSASSTFVFISFRLMENNVITKFEEHGPHDFEICFALLIFPHQRPNFHLLTCVRRKILY